MDRSQSGAKPKISRWEFLNSQFGSWVLTTVLIGGMTWGYSILKSREARADQIDQLQVEIELRYLVTVGHVLSSAKMIDKSGPMPSGPGQIQQEMEEEKHGIFWQEPKATQVLQHQFRDRSTVSLLSEYYFLCENPVERNAIKFMIGCLSFRATDYDDLVRYANGDESKYSSGYATAQIQSQRVMILLSFLVWNERENPTDLSEREFALDGQAATKIIRRAEVQLERQSEKLLIKSSGKPQTR